MPFLSSMALDYSRFKSLTAREIVSALERGGFTLRKSRGGTSHRRYIHSDGRRVTVAYHKGGGTFPLKTLKSILEDQARWTEDDLRRLGLVK